MLAFGLFLLEICREGKNNILNNNTFMVKTEDICSFFFDRLLEVFHKDTIDSHRVRCHNALTLIKESYEVIHNWTNQNVKLFETVKLCLNETEVALKKDSCIRYNRCTKSVLIEEIKEYCKTGEKTGVSSNRLLFFLSIIIEDNKDSYLSDLMSKIMDVVKTETWPDETEEMEVFENLDRLITSFATELIYKGYSKIYLHKLISRLKDSKEQTNTQKINYLKYLLCDQRPLTTSTILKLSISKENRWLSNMLGLFDEVPQEFYPENAPDYLKSYITKTISSKFYIHKSCSAKDSISALKEARESLAQIMDAIHVGDSSIKLTIPNSALVYTNNPDGSVHYEIAKEYVLDGGYSLPEAEIEGFVSSVEDIYSNERVSKDVKERLMSALRHLRIGDIQSELEQKFINYWIALEFIFASPEAKDSTFPRVKENLTCILSTCYIKRNLLYLDAKMTKNGSLLDDEHIWNLSKERFSEIIDKTNNALLRYRIRKVRSLFEHSDKMEKYLKVHEENLTNHISRIYRLRNELIHEAAIKQDIESIASNLRYYLVFLVNQMVFFFTTEKEVSTENQITLSDFFFTFDLWRKTIKENYNIDDIMNVPCETSLISK